MMVVSLGVLSLIGGIIEELVCTLPWGCECFLGVPRWFCVWLWRLACVVGPVGATSRLVDAAGYLSVFGSHAGFGSALGVVSR
jgi:hypothetical protein